MSFARIYQAQIDSRRIQSLWMVINTGLDISLNLLGGYIFLLNRATGISSCSRYLAIVRRAIGIPFFFKISAS